MSRSSYPFELQLSLCGDCDCRRTLPRCPDAGAEFHMRENQGPSPVVLQDALQELGPGRGPRPPGCGSVDKHPSVHRQIPESHRNITDFRHAASPVPRCRHGCPENRSSLGNLDVSFFQLDRTPPYLAVPNPQPLVVNGGERLGNWQVFENKRPNFKTRSPMRRIHGGRENMFRILRLQCRSDTGRHAMHRFA